MNIKEPVQTMITSVSEPIQTMFTKVSEHQMTEAAVRLSKSPLFFMFPELVVNPTKKIWYPYVASLFRVWLYSLMFHHLDELKSIMDLLPF